MRLTAVTALTFLLFFTIHARAQEAEDASTPGPDAAPKEPVPEADSEPKPAPPPPAPVPPAAPTTPPSPSESTTPRRPFDPGAVVLSLDDAAPLFSGGNVNRLADVDAFSIGEAASLSTIVTPPELPYVDIVLGPRITLGGSFGLTFRQQPEGKRVSDELAPAFLTVHGRAGVALPIGTDWAFWPRVGAAFHHGFDRTQVPSQLDLEVDTRFVHALSSDVALTFGVAVVAPLHTWRRAPAYSSSGYPIYVMDRGPSARVAASVGFLARLDGPSDADADPEADARPPLRSGTWIVGVDRLFELAAYESRVTEPKTTPFGEKPPARTSASDTRLGIVDTRTVLPRIPQLSADVVVVKHLTLGLRGGLGYIEPTRSSQNVVAVTVAPRVGALFGVLPHVMLWPRAGAALLFAREDGAPAIETRHVGFEGDLYVAFRITRHFLLAAGPTVLVPIEGRRLVVGKGLATTLSVFQVAASGMVGMAF